jgi:hypothetical protein
MKSSEKRLLTRPSKKIKIGAWAAMPPEHRFLLPFGNFVVMLV